MSSSNRFVPLVMIAAGCLLCANLASLDAKPDAPRAAAATPAQQKPAAPAPATATAATPAAGFVGDDTCTACHENAGHSLMSSLHGKAANPRTPAAKTNQSCETCHGPGKEHAETGDKTKIRVFAAMAPRDSAAVCLTCHTQSSHALWKGSMHESRNLSCVTCHSVHNPKSEVAQLKTETVTGTCVNCHKQEVAKLQRFGHMPVREGKMECTSCHNPHGTTNVRLLKTGNSVNELCSSCHAEKRGPWLFEHAGINGEACSTCHDPHGSSNDRMLVAKLPFLCQRCHNHMKHPSTIYDNKVTQSSNRLFSRSCVTCHSAIHGSNHPSGSTFLRQ